MRLTLIPGVLELRVGRPTPRFRLPRFDKQSLESLLIAISMLRDDGNLRIQVPPSAVLNDGALSQVPEHLR